MNQQKLRVGLARGLALLLAAIMLISILGACSSSSENGSTLEHGVSRTDIASALSDSQGSTAGLPLDAAKSEVVYAVLALDGQLKSTYVVNRIPAGMRAVTDRGAYSDVKLLSVTGELQDTAEGYVASAGEAEPFFYQGILEDATLPWAVSIGYKLNNEVVQASSLSGAEGDLAIDLRITPQESVWAENLMLQISVTLPGAAVRDLSADGGTLALAGSDQIVTYTMLPGAEATEWTIEASVKDFSMAPIQIAAVPMAFDLGDFAIPDFELPDSIEELTQLQDGTKELADGARELADGLDQLAGGSPELTNGFAELRGAADDLDTASTAITEGIDAYLAGVSELGTGGTALSDGFAEVPDGLDEIVAGMNGLADGIDQYGSGVSQYVDGVNPFLGGVQSSSEGATQLHSGAQSMSGAFTQLQTSGDQLTAASQQIYESLSAMEAQLQESAGNPDLQALQQLLAQRDLATAGEELSAGSAAIRSALDQLSGGLAQLTAASTGLYEGLGQLLAGLEQANAMSRDEILQAVGIDPATVVPIIPGEGAEPIPSNEDRLIAFYQAQQTQLLNGLRALYNQGPDGQPAPAQILNDTLPQMADGLSELAEQYHMFDDEIQGMATMLQQFAGVSELLNNLPELSASAEGYLAFDQGLKAFVDGVSQLADGFNGTEEADGLYDGIAGLADGLNQLSDGALPLQEAGTGIKTGAETLSSGGRELAQGLESLGQGLHTFRAGLDEYTGGVNQLAESNEALSGGLHEFSDGLTDYADGMSAYEEGLQGYTSGVTEIASGANQLADGTKELHDGTLDIDTQMDDLIDEMIDKIMEDMEGDMSYETELPSFTSSENGNVSQLQFVIMTEAIPAYEEPVQEIPAEVENENFWTRFLDLFRRD